MSCCRIHKTDDDKFMVECLETHDVIIVADEALAKQIKESIERAYFAGVDNATDDF